MSRARLQTVVADTSALVSLAVPRADAEYDTDYASDPLQYLPPRVRCLFPRSPPGLKDTTQYQYIHGVTAANVLVAHDPRGTQSICAEVLSLTTSIGFSRCSE